MKQKQISNKKFQEIKILEKINEYNNNGKKTIVLFCDAYYPAIDGVIKVLENHAENLSRNNNVILCVPKHKNKLYCENNLNYLVIGVNSISISGVGYDLAFPNVDSLLNKYLKKARIDIIHLHSPFSLGNFAVNLAKKKKIPVIGTFHSLYKQDFYKATKNDSIAKMLTNVIMNVYNKCNLVLTMNSFAAEKIREYGYKGPIKLLQNSIGWTIHKDVDNEISELKKEYNINKNDFVLCFIGRLVLQKQIIFMADVVKYLKEKGLNIKLIFIGKGVDLPKLKKRVEENNIKNNIIFAGELKDERKKSAILGMSHLFMFPSTYDTDGIVKIEAACMSLPTICVKDTGVSSSIIDNKNGFVSELDVEIFANRIIEIEKNRPFLKEVGTNACKDLFITWEKIIENLEIIYNEEIEKMKNNKK